MGDMGGVAIIELIPDPFGAPALEHAPTCLLLREVSGRAWRDLHFRIVGRTGFRGQEDRHTRVVVTQAGEIVAAKPRKIGIRKGVKRRNAGARRKPPAIRAILADQRPQRAIEGLIDFAARGTKRLGDFIRLLIGTLGKKGEDLVLQGLRHPPALPPHADFLSIRRVGRI